MHPGYLLWSSRNGGWFTSGGTYTSERAKARTFSREEAIDMCRIHARNGFNEMGLLPVDLLMIGEILK